MSETIFALASGQVPAAIAVVRVSGSGAFAALDALGGGRPAPRRLVLRRLQDKHGATLDRALVAAFPAPASATGEDIVELHLHGGPAVVAAVLSALAAVPGLRAARAGEFTRRAFESGRLDLAQVEGLADLVAAETDAQRRAALDQAGGALSRRVAEWRATLLGLRAEAEAHLDFADDDDVAQAANPDATARIAALHADIAAELSRSERGRALRDGLTIVVAGPPNVGKSSLVNALARRDVAIVTPLPGTTRDLIETRLDLGGVLVTLVDTAGLRDTDDVVEAAGIARARARAATADLVLTLYDRGEPPEAAWAVRTKADLAAPPPGVLAVSMLTGAGIDELTAQLAVWATSRARPSEPALLGAARHRAACSDAAAELERAAGEVDPVLRAEALRLAGRALAIIVGEVGVDDVLDTIFSRFCIGK